MAPSRVHVHGILWPAASMLLIVASCSSDKRLAEYARQSVDQQAQQNEHIARQSEAVARQSQELAEATHKLVEADARARQELIEAQRQLNGQLQAERGSLDRQREELEQHRRQLASARQREPIVAAAIEAAALTLACLLPLVLCGYALRQLGRSYQDDHTLGDLLIQELAADEPRLLPAWPAPPRRLEHHPLSADAGDQSEPLSLKGDAD